MIVESRVERLPAGTEARLAGFTKLAATAIANAKAQAALTARRRGSWRPPMRPVAGSSGICTTAPGSAWFTSP
jgi:hypothetical protein